MFKSATWRSEKKIKTVFKMQFQATQVPQLKAKTLTVSLVPADVGRPTVRLGKSSILEGTCSWEHPIYETVKLVKDTKTGRFRGKIYHFIVSTGSSKAGRLGEVWVDFVDFLGATNPVMISLPLEATNSGAILHVTVQKVEGTLDQRYIEEDESLTTKYYNGSLEMQLEDPNYFENSDLGFTEGEHPKRITSDQPERNCSLSDTQSENNYANQVFTNTMDRRPEKVSLDASPPEGHACERQPDWPFESTSGESFIDTKNSPKDKFPRNRLQEASIEFGKLNMQINMLERQAEVSELELQSLRRQIAKESRKVQDLSGQIVILKKERDTLKTECEQLKSSPKSIAQADMSNNSVTETKHLREIPEEIKQELHREKHLNKKLRLQLQKTEDSNSELILAVRDLKEVLYRKNKEISKLSGKIKANYNDPMPLAEACVYKMDQKEETKAFEETVREQNKADEAELLKQKMENSRKEKEELKMCIQQLNLDYEILKKEKEDIYSDLEQKQISMIEMQHQYLDYVSSVKQLKLQEERFKQEINDQALLYSESLNAINELETEVQSLEEKLEKEAQDFQDNLTAVSRANVEQEQRAIRAEEALKKVKWCNTKAAEHLREELRQKSEEMTSKIEKNEKLAMQAVAEANDLRLQNEVLEDLLQKANNELQLNKDEYSRKLQDLSKGINLEAQCTWQISPKIDVKNTEVKTSKGSAESDAKAIDIKAKNTQVGTYNKLEKHLCSREAYEEGTLIHDRESEILKKWSEEKEEMERELFSVKKEVEKVIEENITLRTLMDEKKKTDEILHSEMEKLRVQYNELKHRSQEMNLENRKLKKHVVQLQHKREQEKDVVKTEEQQNHSQDASKNLLQQETRPVKDPVMCDTKLEEGKGKGENKHCGELGILKGNTAEIGFQTAHSKRNETHLGRELKVGDCHANNVSDLAKLLNEVASLKEFNKHMAAELKDMQQRYSEISLKFAEVEGERQQLVMTVRSLRNAKKT